MLAPVDARVSGRRVGSRQVVDEWRIAQPRLTEIHVQVGAGALRARPPLVEVGAVGERDCDCHTG